MKFVGVVYFFNFLLLIPIQVNRNLVIYDFKKILVFLFHCKDQRDRQVSYLLVCSPHGQNSQGQGWTCPKLEAWNSVQVASTQLLKPSSAASQSVC